LDVAEDRGRGAARREHIPLSRPRVRGWWAMMARNARITFPRPHLCTMRVRRDRSCSILAGEEERKDVPDLDRRIE